MRNLLTTAPMQVLVEALADPFARSLGFPLGPTLNRVGDNVALVFACPVCQPRSLGLSPTAQAFGESPETWLCTKCRHRGTRAELVAYLSHRRRGHSNPKGAP
jgi:hypothetical protein